MDFGQIHKRAEEPLVFGCGEAPDGGCKHPEPILDPKAGIWQKLNISSLVTEVTYSGEHHGQPKPVGRVNYLLIAH